MKLLLPFLSVILTVHAIADDFPEKKLWKCQQNMVQVLNQQATKLRGKWKKNSFDKDAPAYSSATSQIGKWVSIEKANPVTERVTILDKDKKTRFDFDAVKNCASQVAIVPNAKTGQRSVASIEWFTDQELEGTLEKKPNGIIFIWSPHMSLSYKSVPELRAAADELGLPITFILDPHADQELAKKGAKEHSLGTDALKRANSLELNMRNALIHFPALIVTREGKICDKIQRGYRKAEKFRAIISNIFGSCK
jgi:hypothetical protein